MVELLSRRRHRPAVEAIPQADLERVHPDALAELIHHRFDREVDLRGAKPAHGAGVVIVRVHGVDVGLHVLAGVRPVAWTTDRHVTNGLIDA